jgi:hypothetical protein
MSRARIALATVLTLALTVLTQVGGAHFADDPPPPQPPGPVDVLDARLLSVYVPATTESVPSWQALTGNFSWIFSMFNHAGSITPAETFKNPRITINSDIAGLSGALYPPGTNGPITFPFVLSAPTLDPYPNGSLRQDFTFTNLQQVFTPGFDSSRSVDVENIPPGGATQTVTVRVRPTDSRYTIQGNIIGTSLGVNLDGIYQSFTSPALGAGETLQQQLGPQGMFWAIGNPVLNTEYVFTATRFVPNAGGATLVTRPYTGVQMNIARQPTATTGQSVTITDPVLGVDQQIGGTATFSVEEIVEWHPRPVDESYAVNYNRLEGVVKIDTTTQVSVSPTSSPTYGGMQSVKLAVVPAILGGPSVTGSLQITVDGGAPVQRGAHETFMELGHLTVGDHTVKVTYSGDNNYHGSTTSGIVSVGKADPVLQLVGPPAYPYGQSNSIAVFFQLSSTQQAPTGTISYRIDGGAAQTAPVNGGQATLPLGLLVGGAHTVSVDYLGDGNFNQVLNRTVTVTVLQQNPQVTVNTANTNYGQPFNFSVTVRGPFGGLAAPTGMIGYQIDGGPMHSASLAVSPSNPSESVVSINAGLLSGGSHSLFVVYSGDDNYFTANSTKPFSIGRIVPPMLLTSSLNPSQVGQMVTFTATVSPPSGGLATPIGSVTFKVDGNAVATQGLIGGVATFQTSALTSGSHPIVAEYNGDANYNTQSRSLNQNVNVIKVTPTVNLVASPNPSSLGSPVALVATVSGPAGTPTGNVAFSENGMPLGPNAPLSPSGSATFNTSALSVGSHVITATYFGNNVYTAASAQTTVVVTITAPSFSQIYPMPEGACICTPLLMNLAGNTAGTQNWFFKANTTMALTVTAQSVSATIGGGTVRARVFDSAGVQVVADIVASFPLGTAPGSGASQTASFVTTQDAVYRVEIATPNSIGQAHYLLKFDGAQEAGTNTPTSPSFEEVHADGQPAIWLANAAASEQLELGFFTSTPPAVPGTTTHAVMQVIDTTNPGVPVPLVDLSGAPLGTTATFDTIAPMTINRSFRIAPSYAAAATTPRVYALVILETNGHFKLDRGATDSDRGLYLSWLSAGKAPATIIVQGGNAPFNGSLDVTITAPFSGLTQQHAIPAGEYHDFATVGTYRWTASAPPGYTVTPAYIDVEVLCGVPVSIVFTVNKNPVATTTTVTSSSNPSLAGTAVAFTAAVSPSDATGTVQFKVDGVNFGSPVTLVGGHAVSPSTTLLSLGPHVVSAVYNGDALHLSSSGATPQLVYAFPGDGAFVIGDQNATIGSQVTFWDAQWSAENDLTGTDASSSFKGFVTSSTDASWVSISGNSSNPPATVPTYMAVLVTSSSTKSGSTISGNVLFKVVVRTDAGYGSNPAQSGTGTIVAIVP